MVGHSAPQSREVEGRDPNTPRDALLSSSGKERARVP